MLAVPAYESLRCVYEPESNCGAVGYSANSQMTLLHMVNFNSRLMKC